MLGVFFAVFAGCSGAKQSGDHAISDNLPDSASRAAYEDSLMGDLISEGPSVVTIYGDTLASFGGWGIQVEGPPWFEINHYSRNGIHYLSIARTGEQERVRAVWSRHFVLRLPSMDSTDHVVIEGLCRVNEKEDPLVIAITGTEGDSFLRPARHAWRFNVNRGALEEILTAGVTCSHSHPEGD